MPIDMSAESAGGVQARSGDKAQVVRGRPRRVAAGGGEQCAHAGLQAPGADALQPLSDQNPVGVIELHDISDRAQRDQVQERGEVGFVAPGEAASRAQQRPQCGQNVEHHAHASQVFAGKAATGLVRIDDPGRCGQLRARAGDDR